MVGGVARVSSGPHLVWIPPSHPSWDVVPTVLPHTSSPRHVMPQEFPYNTKIIVKSVFLKRMVEDCLPYNTEKNNPWVMLPVGEDRDAAAGMDDCSPISRTGSFGEVGCAMMGTKLERTMAGEVDKLGQGEEEDHGAGEAGVAADGGSNGALLRR